MGLLGTSDVRTKISNGEEIIAALSPPNTFQKGDDMGQFIDGLTPWINNSNFKVCQNGLDILRLLVEKMRDDFRPFVQTVLPPVIDRLGDSKDSVREKAEELILKLMEWSILPQLLWEKLASGFSHRSNKVREETHKILIITLDSYGSSSLSLNKLVPSIVKCVSDPTPAVRDAAFNTLVEIYRHVGDRVRKDLETRGNVPSAKLPVLLAKFDEIRNSGQLLPTALQSIEGTAKNDDETDRCLSLQLGAKRATSAPTVRKLMGPPNSKAPLSAGSAGGVDEEMFIKSFEDVPRIQFYSAKELEEHLTNIKTVIQDPNNEWSKRSDALKKIRSLMIAGAGNYDELWAHIRMLEHAFQTSVKDLRSQVVREACLTISFMSQQYQNKMDHFAEALFNPLINLIPNSAKIMATAGTVTIRFIIAHTHSARLVPLLTSHMTSKSKDIRRAMCEFLDQLLHTWPTHILEKHVALIQSAVTNGIKDADPDARAYARKAYGGFASHFPAQADALLHSLDLSYQKLLHGEATLSNSSSSHSLHSVGLSRPPSSLPTQPRLKIGSSENLNRIPGIPPRKVTGPLYGMRAAGGVGVSNGAAGATSKIRSNSAIDLQAANRAVRNVRGGYVAPLPPQRKETPGTDPRNVISPDNRTSRNRARTSGSSQSQPGSRSGSPSSRYSYKTYDPSCTPGRPGDSLTLGRPKRLSTGSSNSGSNLATPTRTAPRSNNTSREPSPSRSGSSYLYKPRTRSISGCSEKGTPSRPVLAQKILQQSREAESALSDALVLGRPRLGGYDDHSDESETSSVCSERSMDSIHRRSDRHYRENWLEPGKDIYDIITACSSTHWSERKEGLMGLQAFLRSGNIISTLELRKLIEILGKMFTDSHTKVFSLFLDALTVLIETHKDDLHENLYFIMSRLINKLGADLLGSVQAKTLKTLDLVRYCFPYSLQLALLFRLMMDNTQTPNSRVKVALLNYLTALVRDMQPSDLTAITSQTGSPGLMLGLAGMGVTLSPQIVEASVAKIVAWTSDVRSAEVRKASQDALYSLFSLHPGEVTRILGTLPKVCQDSASQIIQSHLNRTMDCVDISGLVDSPTSAGGVSSPLRSTPATPLSQPQTPVSSSQQQPSTPFFSKIRSSKSLENDENEHINPEEVYKSIRKTTAEIQNYSFEKSSLERDSTSQDSGISQISHVSVDKNRGEGKLYPLEEIRQKTAANTLSSSENTVMSPMEQTERATMSRILTLFAMEDSDSRKDAMRMLTQLMHQGAGNLIEDNFRPVFKHLISCREDPDSLVRRQVFNLWTTMLSTARLVEEMENYADLILVNIFRAQRDQEREVVRSAESCAKTLAVVLSLNKLVRILKHAIGDNYPENYTAIKTLTRLVEQRPQADTIAILPEVMPALLRATDHAESIVRKAAVFCIVEIYKRAPEQLKPYLESLNSSKMKLINVYIQRAAPT